jgi:3-phenylpropionate/trans-cinnamate dioxygenase ferredoxin subunit
LRGSDHLPLGGSEGRNMSMYIEALPAVEVADGHMARVDVDDHSLLIANIGGTYYAADAFCPHLHGHLWEGTLEGTVLTCPRHGSQFDLTDGRNLRWTKYTGTVQSMAEFTRHPRPLRVYECVVEDGKVLIGPQKEPPRQD